MYHQVFKSTLLTVETNKFETQFAYVHLKNATSAVATTFWQKNM